MKAKPPRKGAAPKRYRDLRADFDRAATDTGEDAVLRMNAALKAMDAGRARAHGKRPASRSLEFQPLGWTKEKVRARGGRAAGGQQINSTRALCDRMVKRFPHDIARFERGEQLTGARLRAMIEAVKTTRRHMPTFGAIHRQFTRQFRGGERGVELRGRPITDNGSKKAKLLDRRNGEIYRPPPPPRVDIKKLFPYLSRIRIIK